MAWWGFWCVEVGRGCFFGLILRLLVVLDVEVEDFVGGVGVVGLDGFWVACELFDLESLGEGDGVFVRSGVVEGGGVMVGVLRERWCLGKSNVSLKGVVFQKVLALFRILYFCQGVVDVGNLKKVL